MSKEINKAGLSESLVNLVLHVSKMIKVLAMLQFNLIHHVVISEYYRGFMQFDIKNKPVDSLAGILAAGLALYLAVNVGVASAVGLAALFIIRGKCLDFINDNILSKLNCKTLNAVMRGVVAAITLPLGLVALPNMLAYAGLGLPQLTAANVVSYATLPLNLSAIFASEVAESLVSKTDTEADSSAEQKPSTPKP